jgi:hypothetical protein
MSIKYSFSPASHKVIRGPLIINLGARWRWFTSFTPPLLYFRNRISDSHWIEGWLGPPADRDFWIRDKSLASARKPITIPRSPGPRRSDGTDHVIPASSERRHNAECPISHITYFTSIMCGLIVLKSTNKSRTSLSLIMTLNVTTCDRKYVK